MQKIFLPFMFLVCILLAGCNTFISGSGKVEEILAGNDHYAAEFSDAQPNELAEFYSLVPIKIINQQSKNAYEKYGIDFSGTCYACDLAAISITKKYFSFINVCDENDLVKNEKFTFKISPNSLTLETGKNKFTFTKIDNAPVYELKVTGEKLALKNKKIVRFYTQKAKLNKFKQHDCGDFDG